MTARRIAWAIWGLTAALLISWPFLAEAARTPETDALGYVAFSLAVMGYATVGALITSRQPGNRIGLLVSLIGLSVALTLATGSYAKLAFDQGVGLPFPAAAAWLGRVGFPLMFAPIPLIFLLFPTGGVPSRRWRPLLWLMLTAIGVAVLGFAVTPGVIDSGFTELATIVTNPLGLPAAWKPVIETVTTTAGTINFFGSFLCVISLVFRFRAASDDERQQIRWLLYVGAMAAAIPLTGLLIAGIRELAGVDVGDTDPVGNIAFVLFFVLILLGVPAACGIAILRYRLYELDVVVKKTVVFGALALFITAVYVIAVFVIGSFVTDQASSTVSFAAGAAAALAFQPLRALARRIADRVVYGKRATPYEVLSEFSERLADAYSTEDVLPRMAALLGDGTGATSARVWLHLGGELVPVATWPAEGPQASSVPMPSDELPPMDGEAFPVRHQGALLGAITLTMAPSDPMNPGKEKLVRDVAAQGGLVLRNVRLIEELRASRRRIVEAQDERAKKLERNIHDGAQQQLVGLSVQLRLARSMVDRDPAKAGEMLDGLQSSAGDVLDDLRDLARGIYPPLLADKGLRAALEAQARKSPVPVEVRGDGLTRYPQDVESAVYFCTLEALNNVAKYAQASNVKVRLAQKGEVLVFEVRDDGVGFDPTAKSQGTGLLGMADRLDAIGGELEVDSASGSGTTVRGRIPTSGRPS